LKPISATPGASSACYGDPPIRARSPLIPIFEQSEEPFKRRIETAGIPSESEIVPRRSFTIRCPLDRGARPAPTTAAVSFQGRSGYSRKRGFPEELTMTEGANLSLAEIDRRIAIARDNIRQLIEQAAAFSGAGDESRNADRIARQTEELEKLIKQRDALQKK
jgi:hypothetical protein